jgi:hypothetical protein
LKPKEIRKNITSRRCPGFDLQHPLNYLKVETTGPGAGKAATERLQQADMMAS